MRIIRNFAIIVLVAFAIISCEKDNAFNMDASTPKTAKTIQQHNHAHPNKKCATSTYMEERLIDPTYRANREKNKANFEKVRRTAASRSANCTTPIILPVAIHYQGISSNDRACLEAVAQAAIAAANLDFRGENPEIATQWERSVAQYFPNITIGETCVEFQIASKNHPAGFGLQDGDLAVTINKTNDDYLSEWAGYVNIVVAEIDGLGYSPYGGEGTGDALAVHKDAFAVNGMSCGNVKSEAPFNLGRTLTHELGHYLYLEHIWGDEGGCNQDDHVADTPNQADANSGCPTLGRTKACNGQEALHMNHMDYSDDPCLYMFTAGQSRRMENWVNSVLYNNVKKNVLGVTSGGVITTTTTPTTTTNTPIEEEEATSEIKMKVTLDEFGSETIFYILDAEGDVIEEYGPFQDDQAGKVITKKVDLPTGTYTFVIEDEFGDGMCCDYGRGKWRLFKDGTRIKASNGRFGYWEEYDFTVGRARLSGDAHRVDPKDLEALKNKSKGKVQTFVSK